MLVPSSPSTAWGQAAIGSGGVAAIFARQVRADVRMERNREPVPDLVHRAGALHLPRQAEIGSLVVHDCMRGGASSLREVDEMQSVVGSEPQVGHDQVVAHLFQTVTGGFKLLVLIDVHTRADSRGQEGAPFRVGFDKQDLHGNVTIDTISQNDAGR
jgi:hypothetical protein